jgi:hypothetical protein
VASGAVEHLRQGGDGRGHRSARRARLAERVEHLKSCVMAS